MKRRAIFIGAGAILLLIIVALFAWFWLTASNSKPTAVATSCQNCHGDKDRLEKLTDRYELVYVDLMQFAQEAHGGLACTRCHGGDPTKETPEEACIKGKANKDPAAALVVDKTCGSCHVEITERHVKSVHATMEGHKLALVDLLGEKEGALMYDSGCNQCHATCSGCHMEAPDRRNVLYPRAENHHFDAVPDSTVCRACHGGMGDTYFGEKNNPQHGPSLMARAGMQCTDCHGDQDVHGTGKKVSFAMESPKPECVDCHNDPLRRVNLANQTRVAPQYSPNTPAHAMHDESVLSCEACHTNWYPSCWNCHKNKAEKTSYALFLAVSPLTGKISPAAHSPATSSTANGPVPPETGGGWAIKSRHSWGASQSCETCHVRAETYIVGTDRKSPFIGYWTAKRANAQLVNDKLIQQVLIDANKLKQDAHKDTTCDDCHKSLTDNVCEDCHLKSKKTGTTFLPATADWSRANYILARKNLNQAEQLIKQAKASGINVADWESQWKKLEDNYLLASNEFHGNPGQAQVKMQDASTTSVAFMNSVQQAVVAQSGQNQTTQAGLLFATGTVGAILLGVILRRKQTR